MNKLISIIIPCYNCEKYVERCINSLKKQMSNSFEVIIVDDGSADNSVIKIMETIHDDPRFILVSQENQGVSSARNLGIKKSQSKYLCFVDADDYVSDDYIETIEDEINKSDFDILQFNVRSNEYRATVWSKCIKRSIVIDNEIVFPKNGTIGQDMAFCEKIRLLVEDEKIVYLYKNIYLYEINDESVSINIDKRLRIYNSIDDLISFIKTNHLDYDKKRISNIIINHGFVYPLLLIKGKNISNKNAYIENVYGRLDNYKGYICGYQNKRFYIENKVNILYIKQRILNLVKDFK